MRFRRRSSSYGGQARIRGESYDAFIDAYVQAEVLELLISRAVPACAPGMGASSKQRNIEDAARVAGVGTRTLLRWMKVPEFQTAYREARRAAFGQSIARLQQASSAAVSTLLKVMIDPNTPASSRVRAADSVLGHASKAIEIEEIEARVIALEEATRGR